MSKRTAHIDIVMTRPPGPDGDFVETEDDKGRGVGADRGLQWIAPGADGQFWRLRVPVKAYGYASLADFAILALLCLTAVVITWLVTR